MGKLGVSRKRFALNKEELSLQIKSQAEIIEL